MELITIDHIGIILLGMLIMSCLLHSWAFLLSYRINKSTSIQPRTPLRRWAGTLSTTLFLGFLCCAIWRFPDDRLMALNFHITVIDMLVLPISAILIVQVVNPQHVTRTLIISNLLPFIILCPLCWWVNQYWFTNMIALMMVGYILALLVYIIIVGVRYERQLKDQYSSLHGRSVRWLVSVVLFMVLMILDFVLFTAHRSSWDSIIYCSINLIAWNLVFVHLWNMVQQREDVLAKEVNKKGLERVLEDEQGQEQDKQSLTTEDTVFFTKRLNELCEQEQIYCLVDLTRDELARKIGISHTTFSRLLKETTGQNFYEYINNQRIKKATQLICEGKMDIGSIGQSVGYRYRSTFYRAFAAVHGCTPSEFAEQKR